MTRAGNDSANCTSCAKVPQWKQDFPIEWEGDHYVTRREMVKFMTWAQGIVTLQPQSASAIADVYWIFKVHLFLGMTLFLVFPFTRLVHVWSAPVWYLGRPGYQIVRTRRPTPAE